MADPTSPATHPPPAWWLLLGACALSGGLQAVISPPLNWWFLHLVSWMPGLWALSQLTPGRGFLAGWWTGVVAHLTIFPWVIHTVITFTDIPTAVGVLIWVIFSAFYGFFMALFGWGFGAVRRAAGDLWPLAIAAFFTACEYFSPQLFPFYQGVAWYQLPWIFLVVAVAGVPVITFGVLLTNGVLLQLLLAWRSGDGLPRLARVNGAVLVSLVLFALGYSQLRMAAIAGAEAEAEPMTVALVQTNRDVFAQLELRKRGRGPGLLTKDMVDLAREAYAEHPEIDAFVFAEGALRRGPLHGKNRAILELARDTGAEVWVGGSHAERRPDDRVAYFNSAWRIAADGTVDEQRYDKRILLPFGEFMPLADTFPILRKITGRGSYEAGPGLLPYDSEHARFVFLICYEAIRHRYTRGGVRMGIDLFVNATYDDWYGEGQEQTQHLMLTAIQSALYGVPLVRATMTGISATVDARGVIQETTPFRERTVLVDEVRPLQVFAPYSVLGDWFAWLCALCGATLLVRGFRATVTEPRRLRLWAVVFAATLSAPMNWGANPYLPWGDRLAWAACIASLILVARTFRRPESP